MRVKKVTLTNFRNYQHSSVDLSDARNVLIGENAQGKTNFLEAIEIISLGRSTRATQDADLIRKGSDLLRIEIDFESNESLVSASLAIARSEKPRSRGVERQIKVNGLTLGSAKALRGRLVTVSFKSSDLNLLRGGPKFRRDWIDDILVTLKPTFQEIISKYTKSTAQRNRLLKQLFERGGKITVADQDQMKAWDEQTAKFGAIIIKHRLQLLEELLPRAEKHQEHISGQREKLTASYVFRASEKRDEGDDSEEGEDAPVSISAQELSAKTEAEIAQILMKLMKERRFEEIARKQSLCGPHRDDIKFFLNDSDAVEFGSQGQQRSLVLALKLAELERVQENLSEPPVLLLDDVLAELDLNRQGMLMSLVIQNDMQTLITTTHLNGFQTEWLDKALILEVANGNLQQEHETQNLV